MNLELSSQQKRDRAAFRAFAEAEIIPHANRFDREERIPVELIKKLGRKGFLGMLLPKESGGRNADMITYGLLNEEIGRGCSSVRSLLTVHSMVAHAILRWGSQAQKEQWLPKLATGEVIAAFGLTEPHAGSDSQAMATTARLEGDHYVLNGRKKWITFGQVADLFLIFARCEDKISAFLIARDAAGLSAEPINGVLGVRASMLAELHLDACRTPKENRIDHAGFGFSHIATHALDLGRYSVAWGCVGIGQACLEASLRYAGERKQFGTYLRDRQLIQRMLTDMITNVKAARLLCYQAGYLKDKKDPKAVLETSVAKYFASTMVTKVANDAVQIHGANGCGSEYPVQRYMRDARVMEIIEGSTQIQQITIPTYPYQES